MERCALMHICTACHRHVREVVCPFCGTSKGDAPSVPGSMRVGIRRSALLVASALAVGVPAAGCGPEVVAADAAYGIDGGNGSPDAQDVVSPDAVYGIDGGNGSPDVQDVISASDVYGVPADAPSTDATDATDATDGPSTDATDASDASDASDVEDVEDVGPAPPYGLPPR